MKIALENTDKIVTLVVDGREIPARIWQGVTESGSIRSHVLRHIEEDLARVTK